MASRTAVTQVGRFAGASRPRGIAARPQYIVSGARTQFTRRPFTSSAIYEVKKYTEDHEWVELSADKKTATLGISSYAAHALGDVTYVELPQVDLEVGTGDPIGSVESVKSASDILTPLQGKVIEINDHLEKKPKLISDDPEGEGWVCKIEVASPEQFESDSLMDIEAYKKHTDESS